MKTYLWIGVVFFLCIASSCKDEYPDLPEGVFVLIETNKGEILGRMEYQRAPLTVANFIGLAEGKIENSFRPLGEPYFDGLTFHRVVPNFVIQGGDPQGNGMGGPGYKFRQEIHPDLKHNVAGTFSMANAGPNTNGSQFFITHNATPHLDNGYNVFGYTIKGQEVVNQIAVGDSILHIKVIRKGKEAKQFDAPEVFKANREG